MRRLVLLIAVATFLPATAYAYRLPAYTIADDDRQRPAEEVLTRYQTIMDEVADDARLTKLATHRRSLHERLTRSERAALKRYRRAKAPYRFWNYVVDLKRDIAELSPPEARREADRMAKLIIETIYELSNRYKIAGSALIHNALINAGVKDKGFCYHYTHALKTTLERESWRHYELHWGTAYDGRFLENNGLVITARGKPFASGIVVDPWRRASKPFWRPVARDYYPWKKIVDVERSYDLGSEER